MSDRDVLAKAERLKEKIAVFFGPSKWDQQNWRGIALHLDDFLTMLRSPRKYRDHYCGNCGAPTDDHYSGIPTPPLQSPTPAPDALVAEAERLERERTPGPWDVFDKADPMYVWTADYETYIASCFVSDADDQPKAKADAAFIAFWGTHAAAVLARVRELEREVAELRDRDRTLSRQIEHRANGKDEGSAALLVENAQLAEHRDRLAAAVERLTAQCAQQSSALSVAHLLPRPWIATSPRISFTEWAEAMERVMKALEPTVSLCGNCGHPQSWHRHNDVGCLAKHPQPCTPEIAPFRCLGYDVDGDGTARNHHACDCDDFAAELEAQR